jgi:hypothetical protein
MDDNAPTSAPSNVLNTTPNKAPEPPKETQHPKIVKAAENQDVEKKAEVVQNPLTEEATDTTELMHHILMQEATKRTSIAKPSESGNM